jgi:hypothetical protein
MMDGKNIIYGETAMDKLAQQCAPPGTADLQA